MTVGLPSTSRSILVDTSRLDRILEINEEDMYITVEPGVTWARMAEALAEKVRALRGAC